LRHWDRARGSLTVCLVQRPEFVWPYLLRGLAHAEMQAWVAAEADFHAAEKLLEKEPNEAARYALHVNRGGLHLRQALAATPASVLDLSSLLAFVQARQARLGQAEADFRQAIRLRPGEYLPYVDLARVCRAGGRPAEA